MGFSAGGHVAGGLLTRFAEPLYRPLDAADQVSARPDIACLMYAVISTQPGIAYAGFQEMMRGGEGAAAALRRSIERHVPPNSPPTLLCHAADDATVPVGNSLAMFQGLRAAGVPAELHVFEDGAFRPYKPGASSLPTAPSSADWYRGWRDHLEFAVIG